MIKRGLFLAVLFALSCGSVANASETPLMPEPVSTNIWGLLGPNRQVFSQDQREQLLQRLGVGYVRILSTAPPTLETPRTTSVADMASYQAAGLKTFLTVMNLEARSGGQSVGDMNAFAAQVSNLLNTYRPAYVSVENEVDNPPYSAISASEYLRELTTVCTVSHRLKLPCTDSGMTSKIFIALLVDDYLQNGDNSNAMKYKIYLNTWYGTKLGPLATPPDIDLALKTIGIDRARAILLGLREAGVDRVNLHWYETDHLAAGSTQAMPLAEQRELLEKIIIMIQNRTGLPVLGGEVGQDYARTEDADMPVTHVQMLMQTFKDMHVAPVIWWSPGAHTYPQAPTARSLFDQSGNIFPTGEAFAHFIRQNP